MFNDSADKMAKSIADAVEAYADARFRAIGVTPETEKAADAKVALERSIAEAVKKSLDEMIVR